MSGPPTVGLAEPGRPRRLGSSSVRRRTKIHVASHSSPYSATDIDSPASRGVESDRHRRGVLGGGLAWRRRRRRGRATIGLALAKGGFVVPPGQTAVGLLTEMNPLLASPDPVLRDEVAYSAAERWIVRDKIVAPDDLRRLSSAVVGEPRRRPGHDRRRPRVQALIFGLCLSLIAARDVATPSLAADEVQRFFDRLLDYFARERDLRGYDPVAAGCTPRRTPPMPSSSWPAIRSSRRPTCRGSSTRFVASSSPHDAVFIWGENDRLAWALHAAVRRPDADVAAYEAWTARWVQDHTALWAAGPPVDPGRFARVENAKQILRSLAVILSMEQAPDRHRREGAPHRRDGPRPHALTEHPGRSPEPRGPEPRYTLPVNSARRSRHGQSTGDSRVRRARRRRCDVRHRHRGADAGEEGVQRRRQANRSRTPPASASVDAVYLSGQIGLDPASGQLVEGGTEAQARRVMENLGAVLKEAGLGYGDVVKTTIYMTDLAEFAKVNDIYGTLLPGRWRAAGPFHRAGGGPAARRADRNRLRRRPLIAVRSESVMEMPKPGEAHSRLLALVGRWHGGETLHPAPWDPDGGSATAVDRESRRARRFRRRSGVSADARRRAELQRSRAVLVGRHRRPARDDVVRLDDGACRPNTAAAFDGDVLRLVHAMPHGGFSRCAFDCTSPGRYSFVLEMSPDGAAWTPALEGTYTRVPAHAGADRPPGVAQACRGQVGQGRRAGQGRRGRRTGVKARTRAKVVAARPRRAAAARAAAKRGGRGGRRR